jgi:polyisoprenoid-binding protein YceI
MEKPMTTFRLILATLAVAAVGSAASAEFNQFQAGKSSLTFVSKQMGVPIDGSFRKFTRQPGLRPGKTGGRHCPALDLDLNSIDAGSRDANDEVVGKPWFNVKVFPTATFVSSAVRPLGGDKFELVGKLTIKGKSQDVTAPFSFRQDGGNGVFDGAFVLKRLEFGVGDGVWSDVSTVANEVQIKFHIVAAPAAIRK